MKKCVLISVIFIVGLLACKKDKENITVDAKIYFKGITKIDEMGYPMAPADTTDWRFDDHWTAKEDALFPTNNTTSNQGCAARIILYPNPFQDLVRINLQNMPESSHLAIRLVDKDLKVLLATDLQGGSHYLRPMVIVGKDTIGVAAAGYDTLRIYYKVIDSLNFEYKGHGDILIKKRSF